MTTNMKTNVHYKGYVIEPKPRELADGSGWTVGYRLIFHDGDKTKESPFFTDLVKPTREEAIGSAIQCAKRAIDRSPLL